MNDLLRRLSKPSRSHLVLSGRILSLLSSVFPLGDRSGVNLRGDFNISNVTRIEEQPQSNKDTSGQHNAAEEEENNKDADPSALAAKDDTFYNAFWGLQQYFANPILLFEPTPEQTATSNDSTLQHAPSQDPIQKLKSEETGGSTPKNRSRSATPQQQQQQQGSASADNASAEAKEKDGAAATPPAPRQQSEEEEGAAATRDEDEQQRQDEASSNAYAPPVSALESFKESTRRLLDVFAEASAREREVEMAERAANKGTTSTAAAKKRKREEMLQSHVGANLAHSGSVLNADAEEQSSFPKYLTGRKVFEYQLRSPPFRRHLLLQYLILFQYLLSFTATQKEKTKDWKNQQLLLSQPLANDFTLEESDEKWVRQCWREIVNLIEDTGPRNEGRGFKTSVLQTLRRESRWISWKADNCPPIDKPGLKKELIDRFRSSCNDVFFKSRPSFPHSVGTPALSELWEDGLEPIVKGTRRREDDSGMEVEVSTDGLEQLELPPGIPSISTYAKMIKVQEMKESSRLRKLGVTDVQAQEEQVQSLRQTDEELKLIRERIDSLNWRALRIARASSLRLWGKIETGDVQLLLDAEKEEEEAKRRKREEAEQPKLPEGVGDEDAAMASTTSTNDENTASSAEVVSADTIATTETAPQEGEEESSTAAQGMDVSQDQGQHQGQPKVTEAVDVPTDSGPSAVGGAATPSVEKTEPEQLPTSSADTAAAASSNQDDPDATVYVDAHSEMDADEEAEAKLAESKEDEDVKDDREQSAAKDDQGQIADGEASADADVEMADEQAGQ